MEGIEYCKQPEGLGLAIVFVMADRVYRLVKSCSRYLDFVPLEYVLPLLVPRVLHSVGKRSNGSLRKEDWGIS